jgi:NIMA (never in mitosis gene a)-related kinase
MDQYQVIETIGSGSFGKVCKIRRNDGKILVWKELNYGNMSAKEKELVVSEVNILRELKNPFIVRYYDRIVDKPSTKLYIVMEYCAGGDLGKVVKKCKLEKSSLDEKVIWKVLAQAVVALKDCHRRMEGGDCKPILHRDIKCANVLLDSNLNIKMGDFGLAKQLASEGKMAETNVGTPFYMSPELINERKYDEKTDIWSLGCLIYEIAALRPPFEATNQVALALKINDGKFPRIPLKYSDALFDIIK